MDSSVQIGLWLMKIQNLEWKRGKEKYSRKVIVIFQLYNNYIKIILNLLYC